ncbi:hypothetical protein HDU67_009072 [Dinochytrium kinnereticum]|nr:hypothetical protein HDU67_009072 [Dinochytrium kinnereticum]
MALGRAFTSEDLLDNDLYKFTMQLALWKRGYANTMVGYRFGDRSRLLKLKDPSAITGLLKTLQAYVDLAWDEASLALVQSTLARCLGPDDSEETLKAYVTRLCEPRNVQIYIGVSSDGLLELEYSGSWFDTILLEVPFLSIISEWHNSGVKLDVNCLVERTQKKCQMYRNLGANVIDFGTRRRFSRAAHEAVYQVVSSFGYDTSNVLLASRHGRMPRGTCAHEWFMFHEAITRAASADADIQSTIKASIRHAITGWLEVFPTLIALTDVYGTRLFAEAFLVMDKSAQQRTHFRCDSGREEDYLPYLISLLGFENVNSKTIIYSNALNPERVQSIQEALMRGETCSGPRVYGIGTNFTNDTGDGRERLDIVIKLHKVNGVFSFKTSDDPGKFTGDISLKLRVNTLL